MPEYTHTLVATLGGQPQIVTFTLDLLLRRNIPISEVIVVHPQPSQPRLQHSLECLNREFSGDHYQSGKQTMYFRSQVLHLRGKPLDDIVDDVSANGVLNTIHSLIRDLKEQQHIIHLSVSGGRRLMSLLAISAALLNFDHADHIWHIYTPKDVQEQASEGQLMHVPPSAGIQLIEGPFAYWGPYFPNLRQQSNTDAQTVLRSQTAYRDAQHRQLCDKVVARATPRQRDLLRAFARGLDQQEVAQELHVTNGTIDAHKTKLLDYCREVWGIEEEKRLGYHFLYKNFAAYFDSDEYTR